MKIIFSVGRFQSFLLPPSVFYWSPQDPPERHPHTDFRGHCIFIGWLLLLWKKNIRKGIYIVLEKTSAIPCLCPAVILLSPKAPTRLRWKDCGTLRDTDSSVSSCHLAPSWLDAPRSPRQLSSCNRHYCHLMAFSNIWHSCALRFYMLLFDWDGWFTPIVPIHPMRFTSSWRTGRLYPQNASNYKRRLATPYYITWQLSCCLLCYFDCMYDVGNSRLHWSITKGSTIPFSIQFFNIYHWILFFFLCRSKSPSFNIFPFACDKWDVNLVHMSNWNK